MGSNILGVGQKALAAAQVGIMTTGHNIANATTPGYNRQVVTQTASAPQNFGYGFVGQGTDVASIKRVYNQFISSQVATSQTNKSEIDSHLQKINQINALVSDADTGVSASFQDFFASVQQMNAKPGDPGIRQTAMSSMQTLVGRFQDVADQINSVGEDINTQIKASVDTINTYAEKIAKLNDIISSAENSTGSTPNDLMDQRDQLVLDLNKHVKATVVKQDGSKYSIFVGNGQPLVLGANVTKLTTTSSPSDPGTLQVGYTSGGSVVPLADSSLPGGNLGGLLQFRSQSLAPIKNQIGMIATNFAYTMNEQNKMGRDLTGAMGADLFVMGKPVATAHANNTSDVLVSAAITDGRALTGSDYRVAFDGSAYQITRISDGVQTTAATLPSILDGLEFKLETTAPNAGDSFIIKPVVNGAADIKLAVTDSAKFALAAPVKTDAPSTNVGTGKISSGSVGNITQASTITSPVSLTFDSAAPNAFVVSPATSVTVGEGASAVVYGPGVPVPYTAGATMSMSGFNFTISGNPSNGDKFSVSPNTNAKGDNKNGLALASLQNTGTMNGNTVSFQGAYSQLVNMVGNKTHELQVMGEAEAKLYSNAVDAQQSESGVNLDEEAANLLRYQQAYQAAGKLMQTASQLFDVLLNLR